MNIISFALRSKELYVPMFIGNLNSIVTILNQEARADKTTLLVRLARSLQRNKKDARNWYETTNSSPKVAFAIVDEPPIPT